MPRGVAAGVEPLTQVRNRLRFPPSFMHIYKSRFLVRGEVWYDRAPDQTRVDWIFYRQRSRPVPGTRWKYFHSIVLDLSRKPEALLQEMSRSTVYHIRRARDKDRILTECHNPVSREVLDCFEEVYKRFAAIKRLPLLDRSFLDRLADDGFLEVSLAKDPLGHSLTQHVYYVDGNRSCMLHTVSLHQTISDSTTRNALGRANRYHFWCDILRHRERGLKLFDFGGWYPGKTDQELLQINRFKEDFGGAVLREYNCEQVCSLKGWMALRAAALIDSGKRQLARLRPGLGPKANADAPPTQTPLPADASAPEITALAGSEAVR